VRYASITKRFDNYPAALQFLTGLRFQEGSGQFDARDYQVKAKPLSFDRLADEWLALKAGQIKASSLRSLAAGMRKAQAQWGQCNIKGIQYPQIEDFINQYPGAPKSKSNALAALKQFFAWAHDRYDLPEIRKWPKLGYIEMAFRETLDLDAQELIINDIRAHEPLRVWLGIKWLATYIAVRPGEMRGLKESEVDRGRGILLFPHPKEKRAKIIPLLDEDIAIIRLMPYAFDQAQAFFRHENSGPKLSGSQFSLKVFYHAWKRACARLGIDGVTLYPGTKHSTAMGLRPIATPEQIKSMTLHSTSQAFHRYFQTSGAALKELYSQRKTLISSDNNLITEIGAV
jgi:integrase